MKQKIFGLLLIFLAACQLNVQKVTTPAMDATLPVGTYIRLSNHAEYERGEIIAIKDPAYDDQMLVFRMVAQPGDSVSIAKGNVFINGKPNQEPETIKNAYLVDGHGHLGSEFFAQLGIDGKRRIGGEYLVDLTGSESKSLSEHKKIKSLRRFEPAADKSQPNLFPDFKGWNVHNFGACYLPKKGDELGKEILMRYKNILRLYEGVDINEIESHTFKNSYCFVLGDNRDNAADSRFIGRIPMNYVLGKAVILF